VLLCYLSKYLVERLISFLSNAGHYQNIVTNLSSGVLVMENISNTYKSLYVIADIFVKNHLHFSNV